MKFNEKKEYYSLRKFKGVGLASALVGLAFLSPSVLAEEIATSSTPVSEVGVVAPTSEHDKGENNNTSATSESSKVENTSVEPEVANVGSTSLVTEGSERLEEVLKPEVSGSPVTPSSHKAEESSQDVKSKLNEGTTGSDKPKSDDSVQPTRSRRGKRDVSSSSVPMRTYYSSNDYISTDSSNVQEVSKIDYTTSENPSPVEVDKGIYNNQIESIEEIETSTKDAKRFRMKLKDGVTLPDKGKIVLSSLGFKDPISSNLFLGTTKIGEIKAYSGSSNPDSITKRLQSNKDVDSYINTFESMRPTDQLLTGLVFEFNSNFSGYNKNRVVEFELGTSSYTQVDSLTRSSTYNRNRVTDTKEVDHNLEKALNRYLLNPYDTKVISSGVTKNYVNFSSSPTVFEYSNKATVSTSWGSSNKPYYFDKVYRPTVTRLSVANRDLSSDPVVARANDTFKFEVSENSLFAPTDYKVGDIVEVNGNDSYTPLDRVESNRFTDTDKFVIVKPSLEAPRSRLIKPKFELVEKTDRGYTWKLVEDIRLENSQLDLDLSKLFPFATRRDWVSRFGEDKLKEYLSGTTRNGSAYLTDGQLNGKSTVNIKGVEKVSESKGEIYKNVNILFGEATTGSVKLLHKTNNGVTLKEEVLATNKPWYTVLNIDPSTFEGYQFVSSSESLSTLVGQGDRTIELIYAKPSESVTTKLLPTKYVIDETKDGTYRNTVNGTPETKTVRTEYIYSPETRTASLNYTTTTKEGTPTVVTLGTKPTTEVTYQDFSTTYVADPTRTVGEPNVTIPGSNGSKTVTTTYTVNPKTGEITETVGTPVVKPAKDTIIKVASKDKVEYYRNMGSVIRRTTSYTVNPKTGAVTPVTPVKEELVSSVPNDAPVVDLPEYTEPIGTTPNDAPVLDIPEFTGGVNPYDAPQVEKPEFKGGVTPNDAPVHELPVYKGGVVPNEAPVLELPELKVPEEPAKPKPTNVGGKVEETTQTSTQEPVQENQLPNTGGGDSAKASALGIVSFLAGLGIASRKRKED